LANEVDLLEIPPQSISSFFHQISTVNPFFFNPTPPNYFWQFQDVLFDECRQYLEELLESRQYMRVFKVGNSTEFDYGTPSRDNELVAG